jgi:hypothetical protein
MTDDLQFACRRLLRRRVVAIYGVVALAAGIGVSTVEFHVFSIANMGGMSTSTDGSGDLNVGYSRIQPGAGSTTPAGVAILGYRDSANTLVTETGVPASPLMTAGLIATEVTVGVPSVNTGLAIANPNGQTANISFTFTEEPVRLARPANTVKSGTTTIRANAQLARFPDEAPFSGPKPFIGTFSFTSDVPVSVIALRGLTNERADFLLTTLPVVDTDIPAATGTQVVPYFVTGFGGWTTQVILANPGTTELLGLVQAVDNQGSPVTLCGRVPGPNRAEFCYDGLAPGQPSTFSPYSIAARSTYRFLIRCARLDECATDPDLQGSIRVVPTRGGEAPTTLTLFTLKQGQFTVTEAAAPANRGTAFRMYVEASLVYADVQTKGTNS